MEVVEGKIMATPKQFPDLRSTQLRALMKKRRGTKPIQTFTPSGELFISHRCCLKIMSSLKVCDDVMSCHTLYLPSETGQTGRGPVRGR